MKDASLKDRNYMNVSRNCPHCPNQGWFIGTDFLTGEPVQVHCEFCYTQEDSVFNQQLASIDFDTLNTKSAVVGIAQRSPNKMSIEDEIYRLAVFETPTGGSTLLAEDALNAVSRRRDTIIREIELLRSEIATIMTGGGCSSEGWDDALERSEEVIARAVLCIEKEL